jgi:hypothetical protein
MITMQKEQDFYGLPRHADQLHLLLALLSAEGEERGAAPGSAGAADAHGAATAAGVGAAQKNRGGGDLEGG